MLLLDLTHTSHTRARTGIQRVGRALHRELAGRVASITYDSYQRAWRPLAAWEEASLSNSATSGIRRAQWPAVERWRSRGRRWLGGRVAWPEPISGVIVCELFSAATARQFAALFTRVAGPRVAVFYDAIPLKLPELTPAATVARFPNYLRELLAFDGIAAISEDSRAALDSYWDWLGVSQRPVTRAIPLGVDLPVTRPTPRESSAVRPVVLTVGSLEGRKNHLALFDACEKLWSNGCDFELRVIGLTQRQTGQAALARLQALQAQGRPLHYTGAADDATVATAYAACAFTVYPSLMEGFGLPVLESLAHGKPCVCSGRGALGESAAGGGCVALDRVDADALAAAMRSLLDDRGRLAALAAEARTRTFRTWTDYARELAEWTLSLRPART